MVKKIKQFSDSFSRIVDRQYMVKIWSFIVGFQEQDYSQQAKWDGKVSTRLTKATADQIWPLFKDFFNIHKWFPGSPSCSGIYGTNGKPGCIRYCSGFSIQPDTEKQPDNWAKERLTAVDDAEHSLSYEIVDSNLGFTSYVSKVKIVQAPGDGCVIEWSFSVDPVEGSVLDDMLALYNAWLKCIGQRMEDHVVLGN